MKRRLVRCLAAGLALFIAFAFAGCSGGNSTAGDTGGGGDGTLVAQTFNEGCTLCHSSGAIVDVAVAHSLESNGPQGQITAVTIDGVTGLVTVDFKLFESSNNLIPIAGVEQNDIRFTIAKLVPGTGGDADAWQSYINTTETKEADDPGNAPDGTPTPDGTTAIQATRTGTSGGVFTDNGDGSYSYQLDLDINNVTSPIAVDYEPDLTHRVAMQLTGNVANAFIDFVPATGLPPTPPTPTRNIAVNASCNECHIKLGLHGGDRIQIEYCVTCHNPGTADANSGNTVDFKVMVHKIHYGEELPSINELKWEYAIWGFGNSKHDYSTVVFPQDVRFPGLEASNCTKCHETGDASDSANYLNVPTQEACTSCHDLTSFTDPPPAGFTLHSGGAQADNSSCAGCHPPSGGPAGVSDSHQIPALIAAQSFEYNIVSITDQNDDAQVDPGDFVKVTFSVTDPTNGDAPYNILTDPQFTAPRGASRLAILIGWDTSDYTNTGSGSVPAQPISIDPLSFGSTPATDNGDGTFTVTSTVAIPTNVTDSGVVAIEGHPAVETEPGSGVYNLRVPVKNVFQNFTITGSSTVARRTVVNIASCNRCHGVLSLHGNNRTNEPQVCVICHNANATDIDMRPADPATAVDGKVEEAIDFKYMIHAIHAGEADEHGFREKGIVVYGFGGSVNDFSDVRMPAGTDNLNNCGGCHTGSTFEVPLDKNALPTTNLTEANLASPNDDKNITPTASVCSSCHDSLAAKTHMTEQGGRFDFVAFAPAESGGGGGGGSQADLCGPGPISAQPAGHTQSLDCCSCHGFN